MKGNIIDGGSNKKCRLGPPHYPECGRLCGADQTTHLMTRLGVVEGDVLDYVCKHPSISLKQLIRGLDWQPCIITMGVGSLIREGLVEVAEQGNDVLIKAREAR